MGPTLGLLDQPVDTSSSSSSSSVEVQELDQLDRVLAPDVNAVCARRALPSSTREALERAALRLENREVCATIGQAGAGLDGLVSFLPRGAAREAVVKDALDLARRLARLAGEGATIRATLATLDHDGCRKFHVDWVELRLLCTYVGPGTQWLPNHVARRALITGKDGRSLEEFNEAMCPGGAGLLRAGVGDVVVLKGEAYPGNRGNGVIHRSPPRQAQRRLLLKLDAVRPCRDPTHDHSGAAPERALPADAP